jgi:hypothetical protein
LVTYQKFEKEFENVHIVRENVHIVRSVCPNRKCLTKLLETLFAH